MGFKRQKPSQYTAGFTLLEMSLVLAVVALIIGGIVAGQSLIRSAQLRSAVSEYDIYVKGIKEFQDKYQALPGDMSNATSIWGASTANGDGSGTIGSCTTPGAPANTAEEWYLAWQHLALAGLVPGNFTGTSTDGTTAVIGSNVPASKLSGAGWTINYYLNPSSTGVGLWPDQYGHVLNLGSYKAGDYTRGPILTPIEASNLDSKLDDGMPGTGKVRAWRTNVLGLGNCTTADSSQTAQTYTANSGQQCALVFLLGF
jgi:prepilin-type N-terminal cleavage/methylation domain-containing protein